MGCHQGALYLQSSLDCLSAYVRIREFLTSDACGCTIDSAAERATLGTWQPDERVGCDAQSKHPKPTQPFRGTASHT